MILSKYRIKEFMQQNFIQNFAIELFFHQFTAYNTILNEKNQWSKDNGYLK